MYFTCEIYLPPQDLNSFQCVCHCRISKWNHLDCARMYLITQPYVIKYYISQVCEVFWGIRTKLEAPLLHVPPEPSSYCIIPNRRALPNGRALHIVSLILQ